MDQDERLKLRIGLLTIAQSMAPQIPVKLLEERIMLIPDSKLSSISERFGALAKEVAIELKLVAP